MDHPKSVSKAPIDSRKKKKQQVPDKPPAQLLSLIRAFLLAYGFKKTFNSFTLECIARKKLDDWEDDIGAGLEQHVPDLVTIYKKWAKGWKERRRLSTSSNTVTNQVKTAEKKQEVAGDNANTTNVDSTSSSESQSESQSEGSSDESSSDISNDSSSDSNTDSSTNVDSKDIATAKKPKNSIKPIAKAKTKPISPVSSSSSSSDSDADDEKEASATLASSKSKTQTITPKLKRKSDTSSSATSSSDEGSDSDVDEDSDVPIKKKQKVDGSKIPLKSITALVPAITDKTRVTYSKLVKGSESSNKAARSPITMKTASSSSSSNSDSSSISGSDSSSSSNADESAVPEPSNPSPTAPALAAIKTSSRYSSTDSASSHTLKATSPIKPITKTSAPSSSSSSSSYSSSSIDSSSPATLSTPAVPPSKSAFKRKRSPSPNQSTKVLKKTNTPFKRVPSDTKVDEKLASNKYVPYDYANKAHQDLSVTRGKGFTKEKNKKKKGS